MAGRDGYLRVLALLLGKLHGKLLGMVAWTISGLLAACLLDPKVGHGTGEDMVPVRTWSGGVHGTGEDMLLACSIQGWVGNISIRPSGPDWTDCIFVMIKKHTCVQFLCALFVRPSTHQGRTGPDTGFEVCLSVCHVRPSVSL